MKFFWKKEKKAVGEEIREQEPSEETGQAASAAGEREDAPSSVPAEEISGEQEPEVIPDTEDTAEEAQVLPGTPETAPEKPEGKGFFARLVSGLAKTRNSIAGSLNRVFMRHSQIDEDFYEELEEIMITGDMGVETTDRILTDLKRQVKEKRIREPGECRELLIESVKDQMKVGENAYDFEKGPAVVLIIGVNGVGKTTSVGKMAGIYRAAGKKVLIASADTFRAAANEQLTEWAHRAGVDIISAPEGSDPASVVFDSVKAAKARGVDILLCDTAGRLHNKKNLMEELRKIDRIITREFPEAYRENFIVLDGTTGQNALSQARDFGEVTNLTGIILTKMDGTSRGGIAIAIQAELGIPVKFIGVGEHLEDFQKFSPEEFTNALFAELPDRQE